MEQLEKNKQVVRLFWETLFNLCDYEKAATYISDNYKQHNPKVKDLKTGFLKYFAHFNKNKPNRFTEIKRIIAEDDYVVVHSLVKATDCFDLGRAHMDMFKVKDGLIIEHWDVVQPIPETSMNDNTMF